MMASLRIAVLSLLVIIAGCSSPYGWDKAAQREVDASLRDASQANTKKVPAEVNQALLPPLQIPLPEAGGAPVEPHFDLTVNNAPARQVFMGLVEGTRYSMVLKPDVGGMLSLNLKDVTVPQAMEAIRTVYGYEFRRDGNRFFVLGRGIQTRVFPVNYLNINRKGRSDTRVNASKTSVAVARTAMERTTAALMKAF